MSYYLKDRKKNMYIWDIINAKGKKIGSFTSREAENSTYIIQQWINWTGSRRKSNQLMAERRTVKNDKMVYIGTKKAD